VTPTELWKLVRDILSAGLATFMLIHETLSDDPPSEYIVGAALLLFGVPVYFWLREQKRNGE